MKIKTKKQVKKELRQEALILSYKKKRGKIVYCEFDYETK